MHVVKTLVAMAAILAAVYADTYADDWKPLFDGASLKGWHAIGEGKCTVEDHAIVGRHPRTENDFGHLVTDAVYGDFSIRLKFKTLAGNSGVYFRIDESGFSGVSGFQAEIDPDRDTGGLYETNGRAWVVKPREEEVRKWFRPGQWNEMVVTAFGPKIVVTVNGQKTAEIEDEKGRRAGRIALQLHGGQEGLVFFKDIEIQGTPLHE